VADELYEHPRASGLGESIASGSAAGTMRSIRTDSCASSSLLSDLFENGSERSTPPIDSVQCQMRWTRHLIPRRWGERPLIGNQGIEVNDCLWADRSHLAGRSRGQDLPTIRTLVKRAREVIPGRLRLWGDGRPGRRSARILRMGSKCFQEMPEGRCRILRLATRGEAADQQQCGGERPETVGEMWPVANWVTHKVVPR
jgi:hypothetical protein